jgi:glycosyltransferase involved in cell wall biosynthesis
MRILFCNKYNFRFSGTEAYLFDLMDLLRSHGHQVALFSMAQDPNNSQVCDGQFLVPHIDFKRSKGGVIDGSRKAAHVLYSRQARAKLRDTIREFQPDIAHVRNIYHHLSPSILWELRKQQIPVLYHVNDFKLICPSYNMVAGGAACDRCHGGRFWHVLTQRCYSQSFQWSVLLAAEAYLHRSLGTYEACVTRFLAPSEFVRQKLAQHGWDKNKIDVLHHYQRLPAPPVSDPPPDAPILYLGRLSSEKGVDDLLRALRRLPAIRVEIAGDGPQREPLQQLARELGLNEVRFLGRLGPEDLERHLAACRFTVFPSHAYETFGKSILESWAYGRAVIASDLGSRRELVRHGENGLLYPVGNDEQLAAAIHALYSDPPRALAMGRSGYELVKREYSPQRHYEGIMRIYEDLVAGRTRRDVPRRMRPRHSNRELRIAFIGGRGLISKYSGIESYYEQVGKALAQRGHDVTVYCRQYFTPPLARHEGMRIVRLPTLRAKHLETFLHTSLSTMHALFHRYDLVHYHALGPALFSFIPRMLGVKTMVTVQGLDWQRRKWGRAASAVLRFGERAAVLFPDATTVVSRTLQEHYWQEWNRVTTFIPNGTWIRPRVGAEMLSQWRLQPEHYVLYLGRFSPEKNCDLLIRAFEQIDADTTLVLAGGSSHSDAYAAALHEHESEHIRLLDWVSGPELEALLTNAMMFVLPSDMEGLSLALLDAMGAGLCVLASDIPENQELVEGVGFTFKRGDVDDLARMLALLISDPVMRHIAGASAQKRVREQYLWPGIADQIEQEYLRVLGRRSDEKQPVQSAHLSPSTKQTA